MIFHLKYLTATALLLIFDLCCGGGILGSDRHSGHSHHLFNKDEARNVLRDKEYIGDYEHIKEDIQEMYNKDFADKLDEADMEVFYFQLHDLDNDKQLDGLELLAAMNHVNNRESDIPTEELAKSPDLRQSLQEWWNEKFEEDAPFIDQVLKEEDLDQDGFLNFFEFALGRQREREYLKN